MQRNSPMLGAASGSRSRRRTSKRSFACVTQGLALEASELNNIFDLFYQLERTVDRTGRGLGIGLSLVRRLVEMHGGRATVPPHTLRPPQSFGRPPLLPPCWRGSRRRHAPEYPRGRSCRTARRSDTRVLPSLSH